MPVNNKNMGMGRARSRRKSAKACRVLSGPFPEGDRRIFFLAAPGICWVAGECDVDASGVVSRRSISKCSNGVSGSPVQSSHTARTKTSDGDAGLQEFLRVAPCVSFRPAPNPGRFKFCLLKRRNCSLDPPAQPHTQGCTVGAVHVAGINRTSHIILAR